MPSTLRFLKQFVRPAADAVATEEPTYRRGGEVLEATLYRPARGTGLLPGWVTLHGLTYYGRKHPSLERFAAALAADETCEWLDAPVKRVASLDTWVAYAPQLEAAILPDTGNVLEAIREISAY